MTPPAFLFAGQLAESSGMGRDFYDALPEARELFDRTSEACGVDLASALFEGTEAVWRQNRVAQPAVFLVSVLANRELSRRGITPSAIAGYSLGNYAALVAARAVSFDDALKVLLAVLDESDRLGIRGAMGAVIGLSIADVEGECARARSEGLSVWIGNVNAATQLVLTGSEDGVDSVLAAVSARSMKAVRLPMSWPIHSPLMEEVCRRIAPVVARCESVRSPEVAFYAGHTSSRVQTREEMADLLVRQASLPSRWKETVEAMVHDGRREFIEVGPGETLSRMLRWIARDASCRPAGTLAGIEAIVGKGEILGG
ncbi:MAG: ACP S-malonyltransferase [Thermoanaerobaculia bacterium]